MVNRKATKTEAFTAQSSPQRPAAALVVLDPPVERGRSAPIHPGGLLIGRAPSNGLVLTDPGSSRKHAIVHAQGGEYVIEDRHSLNGTFVNGERITTPQALHDGDRIQFGRLVAEFRLVDPVSYRPRAGIRHDEGWYSERPTRPMGTHPAPRLREELRVSTGFSFGALALAVLGSVVGAVLFASLNDLIALDDQWRTLLGAAIGPVVSTVFTTRSAGETGRVRTAIITVLSSAALVVTATGFSVTDVVRGDSVLPGVTSGSTLPLPGLTEVMEWQHEGDGDEPTQSPSPVTTGPNAAITGVPGCGPGEVGVPVPCGAIIVRNAGDEALVIERIDRQGDHGIDFHAESTCPDLGLKPDEECAIHVTFLPTGLGERAATLVIGHNAPDGETPVALTGVGEGTVEPGRPAAS